MLDVIVDISHNNGSQDFGKLIVDGIQVAIIKATEGLHFDDPLYTVNYKAATAAGMPCLASYHFGNGNDGAAQATHFLNVVEYPSVLVLDFEANPSQMTVDQAEDFVLAVKARTGIAPVLYADHGHLELLEPSAIMAQCPVWLADYRTTPHMSIVWSVWTMWQYTDRSVLEGKKFDRSRFNNDEYGDLAAWWKTHTVNGVAGVDLAAAPKDGE
jgi:lysozyme